MPVWLVLPTYNEAASLPRLVALVRPHVDHVLVVDDASPDGTGAIAEALGGVEVLQRPAKTGIGPAYLAGLERALAAGATRIVQMDADFSHAPADVPRLLAERAGLVIGSRYVPRGAVAGWSPLRRAVSRAGCRYARIVLGVPVRDLTSGFKCWTREALEAVPRERVRSRGYAFQVEMTYRALQAGVPAVEVPITFTERTAGASKMTPAIALEAVWRVPLLRLSR